MTKTLTEQWREGKLPEDTYYVRFICGRYGVYEFEQYKGFGFDNDLAYIKEVLAPVPSYDEYKQLVSKADELEKKLEIATNALKQYSQGDNWLDAGCRGQVFLQTRRGYSIADKALDEMEEV